ncbi:Hypothetical protein, partial CDS, partial [Neorhizobium galegae bv. orientalis]
GVENVILFRKGLAGKLKDLKPDTFGYFMKLPGHDTLRLILSRRAILVEGPSDELIVQKAYFKRHGRMPLSEGVDVITVNSLAFARFLEIAELLKVDVSVVTDNDGKLDALAKKYEQFKNVKTIKICYDTDVAYKTMEPQLVKRNGLAKVNAVLGTTYGTEADLMAFMAANKTECALRFFDSKSDWDVPGYIEDAIK